MQNLGVASPSEPVLVERWPTERPLLALVVLVSIGIWILLAMTMIGLIEGTLDADQFPPLPAAHCRTCNFLEMCPAGKEWMKSH